VKKNGHKTIFGAAKLMIRNAKNFLIAGNLARK